MVANRLGIIYIFFSVARRVFHNSVISSHKPGIRAVACQRPRGRKRARELVSLLDGVDLGLSPV